MHKSSDAFKEQELQISRFVTVMKTDRKTHACSGMHEFFSKNMERKGSGFAYCCLGLQ